mgnify:CR=1 FL=1
MKMRVILDSDDVLFPCNEVAVDHLNKAEGTAYTLNDIKKWGFLGNKLDKRLSYFKDPSFIRNLQPYWNAQMFVAELAKMAEIFVATSVDPFCAGERVNSIIRHFPEINPENILIGNRKELKEAEVISRQGIFCPPIVSSQAQKANFTDLDIREMKVIPLNSKKAKLLSVHPADSYTLETGEDGNMTLKINDENNFWKQTKYLVVMIG